MKNVLEPELLNVDRTARKRILARMSFDEVDTHQDCARHRERWLKGIVEVSVQPGKNKK
jgi:hypothetical protein